MTTKYIKASGGDYTDIQTAVDAYPGGEVWELVIDDTRNYDEVVTVDEGSDATYPITITVSSGNRHSGVAGTGHARIYPSSNPSTGRVFTLSDPGVTLEWLDIELDSTDTSDEGIRYTETCNITNCIVHAPAFVDYQDGIYQDNNSADLTVSQCYIYGFSRGGIHWQNYSGSSVGDVTVNSTFVYNCNPASDPDGISGGGIAIRSDTGAKTIEIMNTVVLDCHGTHDDYFESWDFGLPEPVWGISYSVDSDNSIATVDGGGTGNLASRTATDSDTPGTGDWVVVNDITTNVDLTLKDNSENDAQDAHAVATAEGLTIPSTDIAGTSRPVNTNYDIGPFEISTGVAQTLAVDDAAIGISSTPALLGDVPKCALYDRSGRVIVSADDEIILAAGCVAPADCNIGISTTEPVLIANQTISPDDANIGISSTEPVLAANQALPTNDSNIGISTTEPALIQAQQLLTNDAAIGISTTQPTLIQGQKLYPYNAGIGISSTEPTLIQSAQFISPDDCNIGISTTEPTLVQGVAQTLAVDDASIGISTDPVWLGDYPACTMFSTNGQPLWTTGGELILQYSCVPPDDASIGISTTEPGLILHQVLSPFNATIGISTTEPDLSQSDELAVNNAAIGISSTEPALILHQIVAPDDCNIGISSTETPLLAKRVIIPDNCNIGISTTEPQWAPEYTLETVGINDVTKRYGVRDVTKRYSARTA